MKTKTLASVALMALVLAAMTIGATGARFTDSATSTANTFTTGTLDLKLADNNESASNAVTSSITVGGLRPGDTATDKPIVVSNSGTLAMKYTMATTIAAASAVNLETTASNLTVTILLGSGGSCGSVAAIVGQAATALSASIISTARTLAAGASETLCFRVAMPTGAANNVQGASATATFTFSGVQTRNNP